MVGLLALLDDMAVLMKMAAKKTTGVIGDDLALNAQQLNGITPERELPIVWGVFKGSLKNKLILVPTALLISAWAPWAIMPLLMIGGSYLCFEGVEKLLEKFFHHESHALEQKVVTEADRIKGAVKTDFILSAEIVVITLGTVATANIASQILVVSLLSLLMTLGVYGFVALLIKLDDMGIYLFHHTNNVVGKSVGKVLMNSAPFLMMVLGVVGTAAMFLVGGGIVTHSIHAIGHTVEHLVSSLNGVLQVVVTSIVDATVGVLTGLLVVAAVTVSKKVVSWVKKPTTPAVETKEEHLTMFSTEQDLKNMKENKDAFVTTMGQDTYDKLVDDLEESLKNKKA